MSALLHLTNTPQQSLTCIAVYDFEPPRGEHMDKYIAAYACGYADTQYQAYVQRMQQATSALIRPPVKHTYQRVQTQPASFASYPIGSVLCLQLSETTCRLMMVVNRDVGWIRTNIRHRVIELGEISFIPMQQGTLATYISSKMTDIAQQHITQMENLERETIALAEKNDQLEEKCARLLQHVRAHAGDKVAFEAINDNKMSYTPLAMKE